MASAVATLFSASAAIAGGCNWGNHTAQTEVNVKEKRMEMAAAKVPMDAWLIKYMESWQNA